MAYEHSTFNYKEGVVSIVKEVVDDLGILADGIENTRKIYNSIRDGKEQLENAHPDIRHD